ncbi:hypothetical protein L211DRAFT_848481 [Terfezia boudieri ATCC MYA-4762]|uniref:Uncharacterized protein n=1 Tax=Terfezia boudieri ATCC MYA-4762 TaxID=1051890 RepID=A0A3N4LTZ3_9PEZI|nr:hypothetical protein L211DRAFT_848481 [Terfezia boudieri ATCC MYA-4762]
MARQAKGTKKAKKPDKTGPLSVAAIVATQSTPRSRVNWRVQLNLPAAPVVVPPAPAGPRPRLPQQAPANSTAAARRTAQAARAAAMAAQDVWDLQQQAYENAVAYNNGQRRSGRAKARPKRLLDEKD